MTHGDEIFVTGMLRSGTTLLEKLLAQQERISMLLQPFPLLFVEAKRAFLRELGHGDDSYPLGHLFGETRYTGDDLARFLSRWRPSREEFDALFARMSHYSGQSTRFGPEQLEPALEAAAQAGDFVEVVSTLLHLLAVRPEARWFGSKEITCEELVPLFLQRGFRCVIIIRDPRDVVTSLNHGAGRTIAGDVRPTLFNVRAWRKSVAVARECERSERFFCCRYEDLVADPERTMRELAAKLDIDLSTFQFDELRDESGAAWSGNSSHRAHDGVRASSVGMFRALLPPPVSGFVEAVCLPELQSLGYDTTLTHAEAVRALHEFREPYTITRGGMESDMATPDNALLEEQRLAASMPKAASAMNCGNSGTR